MSQEHKDALAKGRAQAKTVRDYLAALDKERKPGRKIDRSALEATISETRTAIDAEEDPAKRLVLIQKRLDLQDRLAATDDGPDIGQLESAFIADAAAYSQRKSISYTAWREIGVPAAVLKAAGIRRTRRPS